MSPEPNPIELLPLHSFATPAKARALIALDAQTCWPDLAARLAQAPWLILGGGTNLLFVGDFDGTVLHGRQLLGREYRPLPDGVELSLAAGENWNQAVWDSLERGLYGLENLVEIPGLAGAAPVQNIGAYGVELAERLLWVEVVDLLQAKTFRLTAQECQFGYRDSCFKRQPHWFIRRIGLKLKTYAPLSLDYGPLAELYRQQYGDRQHPKYLAQLIAGLRWQKLPRPAEFGNAGSFFKNPLVSSTQLSHLQHQFPQIPHYAQADGRYKLAAGWLIEQAGLKGFQLGRAAVYSRQALVLINAGGASGREIWQLAQYVQTKVCQQFGVELEPEVRCIGLES